jgi:hypothetical protein
MAVAIGRRWRPTRRAWDWIPELESARPSLVRELSPKGVLWARPLPVVETPDCRIAGRMPKLNAVTEIGSVIVLRGSSWSSRSVLKASRARRRSVKLRRKRWLMVSSSAVAAVCWRGLRSRAPHETLAERAENVLKSTRVILGGRRKLGLERLLTVLGRPLNFSCDPSRVCCARRPAPNRVRQESLTYENRMQPESGQPQLFSSAASPPDPSSRIAGSRAAIENLPPQDLCAVRASRVGLKPARKRAVGWVEPRRVAARPTARAVAIGGPHDAQHRSTHPTTDCGAAALGNMGVQRDVRLESGRHPLFKILSDSSL